jgi:hypothetical protein
VTGGTAFQGTHRLVVGTRLLGGAHQVGLVRREVHIRQSAAVAAATLLLVQEVLLPRLDRA